MIDKVKAIVKIQKGTGYPLGGVWKNKKEIQFSIYLPNEGKIILHLYNRKEIEPFQSIEMDEKYKVGGIFSIVVTLAEENGSCAYQYQIGETFLLDPYGKQIAGREKWGQVIEKEEKQKILRCVVPALSNEKKEEQLGIPYEELILYHLHVRGFTRHKSSKVHQKGTFKGLIEKISYLKEIGINGILMMPCYEFDEIIPGRESKLPDMPYLTKEEREKAEGQNNQNMKLNFWGYTDQCSYFAPKTSYASDTEHPVEEIREMIKEMHKSGIAIFMEILFAPGTNQTLILDCLRYWVLEFGIDGFKINNEVVNSQLIATDPYLSGTKFFATGWDNNFLYGDCTQVENKVAAEYNDGFLVFARKYLKGDEEQVSGFLQRWKYNPYHSGVINYLTNHNTMTLLDMVSYDIKHNEANQENGKDGTDYNFSWNCGFEGETRKKQVMKLRQKQIRNALIMLFLSQGTPMILAGDEYGNTQKGNNNAYCQDNEIGWVVWKKNTVNEQTFQWTKALIKLRKEHPIFHMPTSFREMDYIACGCPDISFHGTKAWYPDLSNYSRVLGIMLCGKYAPINKRRSDDTFYIAFNMHWESHTFDLPEATDQRKWHLLIDTEQSMAKEETQFCPKELVENRCYEVKPRSIAVFVAKKAERNIEKKKI